MRFFRNTITIIVVLSCAVSFAQEPVPSKPSEKAGYHIYAHAHNDYEHEHPLFDALDHKFYSVEADFWLVDGELLVAHNKGEYKGKLKDLYLDPLQKLVDEKGSVFGNGEVFYLWLDIKDNRPETMSVLHELLQKYSMLTVFDDFKADKIDRRPVVAVLTGDHTLKTLYTDTYLQRWACRDSNYYNANDPQGDNRWMWYAVNWGNHFQWRGQGEMPKDEYNTLVTIVNDIHAKGRKIRFYSTPDVSSYWQLALDVGIDFINSDLLVGLDQYLSSIQN